MRVHACVLDHVFVVSNVVLACLLSICGYFFCGPALASGFVFEMKRRDGQISQFRQVERRCKKVYESEIKINVEPGLHLKSFIFFVVKMDFSVSLNCSPLLRTPFW